MKITKVINTILVICLALIPCSAISNIYAEEWTHPEEFEPPFIAVYNEKTIELTFHDYIASSLAYAMVEDINGNIVSEKPENGLMIINDVQPWVLYSVHTKLEATNGFKFWVTYLMLNQTRDLILGVSPSLTFSSNQYTSITEEVEPNSCLINAQAFSRKEKMCGAMASPVDVDIFHIVTSNCGTTGFYLTDIMPGNDFDLILYDYLGEKIMGVSSKPGNSDEFIAIHTNPGEGYYIQVVRKAGANLDLTYSLCFLETMYRVV